jgi:LysM repeat protein
VWDQSNICSIPLLAFERLFADTTAVNRTSVRLLRRAALRRRRLARTLVVATAVASGLGFLAGHATARAERPSPPPTVRAYVVHSGDTLWSIAANIVGPEGDPRPVVDALVSRNHIVGAVIVPGERLYLPAPSSL